MARYVIRRLGWTVAVLFLITVITFLLSRVVPANPAAMVTGLGASTEQIQEVRRVMGLDKPLTVQYERYMRGLVQLDLGKSIRTQRAVTDDLRDFLPATFELMIVSFVIYVLIAVPLGMLAAIRTGGVTDFIVRGASTLGSGVPVFWLALVLQLVFFARLGVLPSGGRIGARDIGPAHHTGSYLVDSLLAGNVTTFVVVLKHMILPVATIVTSLLAVGVRLTRASFLQEMGQQYVRTARSKGLTEQRVMFRHVLRNALNPVISMFGIQLGYLLAWIVLVETIFQWPGIGLYAYNSFQSLDYAPIMGLTLVFSVFFVLVNLLTDLIYPLIDPRISVG